MFFRLWHHTFIRCDHKQRGVDPANSRQHVFDEISMTRDIHNPNLFPVRECHPTETKFDRHLAGLFFLEAIGMSPGQRCNERRLSVINMTGCANYAHVASYGETDLKVKDTESLSLNSRWLRISVVNLGI